MSLMLQCIFFALLILCLSSITSVYSEANDNVQPISNPTNNFCDRLQQSSSQPMAFQAFVADPKNGDLILFVESNQLYQAQKADLDHFAHHELTEPNWFKYLTDQLMTKGHFTEDAKQIRWFHFFRKDDETVLILETNDSESKTEYHYYQYVGDKIVPDKHKQQKPFRMISSLESNAKQVHYVFTYDSKTNQIVMIQNGDQQVSAFNATENLDVSSYIWTIDSGTGRITLKSQTEQIKPDELLFTSLPVGFIHGNTVYLFQVDTKMVITMKYRDISADEDKQRDESIRAIPMSKFFVNCVTNANVFLTSTNESDIGITTGTTEPNWLYYLTNNPVMIVLVIVLVVLLVVCIILACKCFCKSNNRLGHLSKKWKSLDYLTTRKKNPKPIAKKSSSTIESSSGSSSEWTSTQKTVGAKRQTKRTPKESPSNVKHQKTSPMGVGVSPIRPTTTRSASPAGKLAGRKQTISTGRREVALCTHQRHSPKKVTVNTSPKVLPKKIPSVPPSLRGCIVDPLSPLNTAKQGTVQNSLAIAKQNKRQQPK